MKVALLLPSGPDMGWVWRLRALAEALREAALVIGRDFEVVAGLPKAFSQWEGLANDLMEDAPWLSVRPLEWRPTLADQFHRAYRNIERIDFVGHYNIPCDGGWNYSDCDAWIVCADERVGAPPPLKPTAVYCRSLASRYVAGMFGDIRSDAAWSSQTDAFLAWRQSRCVFAVEKDTLDDVVGYAGVRRSKTLQIPSLWSRRTTRTPNRPLPLAPGYLAWLVEPSAAHDPLNALEGLADYVSRGGRRSIALVGQDVAAFDLKGGPLNAFRLALAANVELLARITVVTTPHAEALNQAVSAAGAVWSSLLADGEPEAPRLAADYGKRLLAVDFPQAKSAGMATQNLFYEPFQRDVLADALFELDRSATQDFEPETNAFAPSDAAAFVPILQRLSANER